MQCLTGVKCTQGYIKDIEGLSKVSRQRLGSEPAQCYLKSKKLKMWNQPDGRTGVILFVVCLFVSKIKQKVTKCFLLKP
jgi:hypothetical protein